jgi:hypothetical protein
VEVTFAINQIELIYKDGDDSVAYKFLGCYNSIFNHVKSYDKFIAVKDMTPAQVPYFMQDVEVGEVSDDGINFYICKINMFPLHLEIWCKDIKVDKQKK